MPAQVSKQRSLIVMTLRIRDDREALKGFDCRGCRSDTARFYDLVDSGDGRIEGDCGTQVAPRFAVLAFFNQSLRVAIDVGGPVRGQPFRNGVACIKARENDERIGKAISKRNVMIRVQLA